MLSWDLTITGFQYAVDSSLHISNESKFAVLTICHPASAVVLSVLQYRIEKCIFLVGAQIRSIERAAAVRHSLFVQPRPSLKLVTTLLPYQLPNDFCLALSCCLACLIHTPHLYCLQDTLNTANPHQLLILLYHHLPTYARLKFLICEFKSVGCMHVNECILTLVQLCMWESTHIIGNKWKIYDETRLFFSSEVINCSTALISLNSCNTCKLESTWYLMKIFFSAFLFRGYHSQWVLLDAWLVRFMFQWCFTAISSLWSSQSFRYVLHQCNAWLGYICLNCAILRRTLVLVHFVFFFQSRHV